MRDRKLLEEYRRSGSDVAFAQIVDRYLNPVFTTCLREVNDRQAAEDLTQAVFLLLARKAPTLNPNVILSGWLFNACRLLSRNMMRAEQRRRNREQKTAQMDARTESEQWESLDGIFNEALAALSSSDRLTILLRYFDELSVPEVAQELGVSTDAAHMRLRRAVDRLRRILTKQGTTIPTGALATLLASGVLKKASAELGVRIVSGSAATGTGLSLIVEAAMKQMWLAQLKTALGVATGAVIALGVVGTVAHQQITAHVRPDVRQLVHSTRPISTGCVANFQTR